MKYIFLFAATLTAHLAVAQYGVDGSLKERYWTLFGRLPELIRNGKDTTTKKRLGILVELAADTLNKNDRRRGDVSVKIDAQEPDGAANEYGWISDSTPVWLDCSCGFRGDTFEVVTGLYLFSGFAFTTRVANGHAAASFTAREPEGKPFKTALSGKRVNSFVVPARVSNLVLDRRPQKGMEEIYGSVSLASADYYTYLDVFDFRHGYIHQRMRVRLYFHCRLSKDTLR